MAQEIALRIYGGGLASGFAQQPIVTIGSIPTGYVPTPPTLVDEDKVWLLAHTQSHTVYSLYSRACRTSDGKAGQLLISLFLPSQRRLADGVSPLGLLNTLLDVFSIQSLADDTLPQAAIDPSPFMALLKRYHLEDRQLQLPVMEGRGPASFCVTNLSQIDALMRHSRYPVLSKIGQLEIGLHCTTTVQIPITGTARPTNNPSSNPQQKREQPQSSACSKTRPKSVSDQPKQASQNQSEVHTLKAEQKGAEATRPQRPQMSIRRLMYWMLLTVIVTPCLYWIFSPSRNTEEFKGENGQTIVSTTDDTTEINVKQRIREEVAKEMEEMAQKQMDATKAKKEILDLINKNASITTIRNHEGWGFLSLSEKLSVELICNYENQKTPKGNKLNKVTRQKIKDKTIRPFRSFEELQRIRMEITRVINKQDAEDDEEVPPMLKRTN